MIYSGAIFSDDKIYRYQLWRKWYDGDNFLVFIGLNPSTANEYEHDPTIRRCISFAANMGYSGMYMMNLFAFRSTDPSKLLQVDDPIGPDNNEHLLEVCKDRHVIAAWGNSGSFLRRCDWLTCNIKGVYCFGLTKQGQPKHPLYLKKDTELIKWS